MFELHAVQAFQGDSLLLVFGTQGDLHYILIDGGPPGTYAQHLRPTLLEIAAHGGRLDRVLLTHTDDDHVTGLVDLCAELRSRQLGAQPLPIAVDGMWMNSFAFDSILAPQMAHIAIPRLLPSGEPQAQSAALSKTPPARLPAALSDAPPRTPSAAFSGAPRTDPGRDLSAPPEVPTEAAPPLPLQGVAEAVDLQELVAQLDIPRNEGFGGEVICLPHGAGAEPIVLTIGGLKLTLIGPTQANLDRMGREWRAWLQKNRPPTISAGATTGSAQATETLPPDLVSALRTAATPVNPAAFPELPARAPAPAHPDAVAPDQSIPNRSSIMLLAEYNGRRILLTGDGRGDHIVRSLERQGFLPKDGTFHVDILHVPHHGSARNSSRKFFTRVTADTYVFSADGTNGNPDFPTLRWVVESLKAQNRHATLAFTNEPPSVVELQAAYPPALNHYTLAFRPPAGHALRLALTP